MIKQNLCTILYHSTYYSPQTNLPNFFSLINKAGKAVQYLISDWLPLTLIPIRHIWSVHTSCIVAINSPIKGLKQSYNICVTSLHEVTQMLTKSVSLCQKQAGRLQARVEPAKSLLMFINVSVRFHQYCTRFVMI